MRYIEVTGKTEEEALSKALEQLGMDRDDVSVEILERAKSGFLGIGGQPAKIRVSYGAEEEAEGMPVQALEEKESEEAPETEETAPVETQSAEEENTPAEPEAQEQAASTAEENQPPCEE